MCVLDCTSITLPIATRVDYCEICYPLRKLEGRKCVIDCDKVSLTDATDVETCNCFFDRIFVNDKCRVNCNKVLSSDEAVTE